MNLTSENQTLVLGAAGGAVVLLFILLLLVRKRTKKRKHSKNSSTTQGKTNAQVKNEFDDNQNSDPSGQHSSSTTALLAGPIETKTATTTSAPSEADIATISQSKVESFLDHHAAPLSHPEFGELFVVEDPLEGSGYLATQINRETSYISDFEIRALIKRFEAALLSEESLQSGFAEKSTVAGKVRTVLFGEVEAISKSTAGFHPEIVARIERAQAESGNFRLLAIDGLVYGVFEIKA